MFEVSWSELLVLGVATLILVGPKELPRFLSTLGRYLGVVRRHANDFRAVFEEAMREAEMDSIQKEVRQIKDEVKASIDGAARSVESVKTAINVDEKPLLVKKPVSAPAAKPAAPSEPQEELSAEASAADAASNSKHDVKDAPATDAPAPGSAETAERPV